jgi:hypothetical protein
LIGDKKSEHRRDRGKKRSVRERAIHDIPLTHSWTECSDTAAIERGKLEQRTVHCSKIHRSTAEVDHEPPRLQRADAAERPLIADTMADDWRGCSGPSRHFAKQNNAIAISAGHGSADGGGVHARFRLSDPKMQLLSNRC